MTLRVSAAQRQGRLVERQLLGAQATTVGGVTTVDGVAESLVALHGTDPVTVYLSVWARSGCSVGDVDTALYAERSVVRMLGMRRTVFVVPAGLAGVVQAACTDDVAVRLRRQLVKDLTSGGVGVGDAGRDGDAGSWLRSVEDGVLRALAARGGGAAGAKLAEDEPRLRTQLTYALDKSYGGAAYITSRVLVLIAAEGRIVRGHRRGGWSSGQFEWFLPEAWLGRGADGGELAAEGLGTGVDASAARVELARRWLAVFGPAPAADLQWWAGWTGAQTKAALAALPTAGVDLDGQPGVVLADDLEFPAAPPPAALLPGLDPTPMGWQSRSWFLGPHAPPLFDRTGNIGPTVWRAGRVVGGWAQRASGEVVYRLLEDIGGDGETAVAAQAQRLEAWLGETRVTPRFRTPLERELTA
ncbi:MAG TPA: winged helix DNA-binding domain-containing protein, partial [Trebonia sp.]